MIFDNDFIGIYDDALTKQECEMIINRFETKDKHRQGRIDRKRKSQISSFEYSQNKETGDPSKICTEICFSSRHSEDIFYHRMVQIAIERKFYLYRKKNSFLDYGSTSSQFDLSECYNLQKYTDDEGYFALHCEHGSIDPHRMLVWMIYLNDAKCGTEFPVQKKTVKPKTGRLVVWPAAWTHPHRGVTPNIGEKYILTGWWNYLALSECDYENDSFLYDPDSVWKVNV